MLYFLCYIFASHNSQNLRRSLPCRGVKISWKQLNVFRLVCFTGHRAQGWICTPTNPSCVSWPSIKCFSPSWIQKWSQFCTVEAFHKTRMFLFDLHPMENPPPPLLVIFSSVLVPSHEYWMSLSVNDSQDYIKPRANYFDNCQAFYPKPICSRHAKIVKGEWVNPNPNSSVKTHI